MTTKTNPEELLLAYQLAESIKVSPAYVSAMKRCGYQFEFGRRTTRAHALQWIKQHPWFRFNTAYPKKPKE